MYIQNFKPLSSRLGCVLLCQKNPPKTEFLTTVIQTVYRKVPKFSEAKKLCCNLPKIQTKSPNLRIFSQEDANGIANSEDPDQTAPLGAV